MDRTDAFFGARLPIEVPVYARCDCYGSSGGDWGVWRLMPRIRDGRNDSCSPLEIAPGVRSGEHYQIDLTGMGIHNLALDVPLVVA